ncbi:hypothetical protein HN814_12345, partial [Candidatus Woesearchaeota archaeon]|nr:hypothetical protein [Candidatus Woesearchaeota archaeon]
MNYISVIGLLVLLGLAWAMSYHRTEVKMKPIFWGIGLQFLFADIILAPGTWSFFGMGILSILIIIFILQKDDQKLGGGIQSGLIIIIGSIIIGTILYYFAPVLGYLNLAIILFMILNSRFNLNQTIQRYAGTLFIISGLMFLITNNLYGQIVFKSFSDKVSYFLSLSDYGAQFLFANLANGAHFFPGSDAGWPGFGFQFAFKVLPTIIFFGGFMSVLYYFGIMQKIVVSMSKFMRWTIGTSGAETLSCSANIFVGQTEAPLLIKPFLNGMTKSELTTVMVGGFATIAGGVLAGFIAMGIDAGHLIAASVMSAPAALVIGKIIFPEKEHSQTAGDIELPDINVGSNAVEAATNGITDGLKLAVNVGAMLIGFIAIIAVIDVALNWLDLLIDGRYLGGEYKEYTGLGLSPATGEYLGFFPGSLQTLFGTILKPLAFLMGVPWNEAHYVGNLLGI